MTARTDVPFNRALMASQAPKWIIYFFSTVPGWAMGQGSAGHWHFRLFSSAPCLTLTLTLSDSYSCMFYQIIHLSLIQYSRTLSSYQILWLISGAQTKPGMAAAFKCSVSNEGKWCLFKNCYANVTNAARKKRTACWQRPGGEWPALPAKPRTSLIKGSGDLSLEERFEFW